MIRSSARQQRVFLILPLFSLVYGWFLPAGLFIYWITTTIFSIVQQYLINGWGGLFPLFGWTPGFAVNHTPRFPVAPLTPRPPDPSSAWRHTRCPQALGDRQRGRDHQAGEGTQQPARETPMSEYQEFTGRTVEEAIRAARESFGVSGLDDLDFEILTPGSRGVLGMGAEPARIIAAPRAALGGGRAAPGCGRVRTPAHRRAPREDGAQRPRRRDRPASRRAQASPRPGPRRAARRDARTRSRPSRPAPTRRCRCAARDPTAHRATTDRRRDGGGSPRPWPAR